MITKGKMCYLESLYKRNTSHAIKKHQVTDYDTLKIILKKLYRDITISKKGFVTFKLPKSKRIFKIWPAGYVGDRYGVYCTGGNGGWAGALREMKSAQDYYAHLPAFVKRWAIANYGNI